MKEFNWWALSEENVINYLETSKEGLSSEEASKRLKKYGANEVISKTRKKKARIFIEQFRNLFIPLLIVAAIISFFLGEKTEGIVIILIVLMSSFLGFFQDYKAERAVEKLRKYIRVMARVVRDGKLEEIDSRNLVVGDVVKLQIGDIVPADIRLIYCDELNTNEASLTGESREVAKTYKRIAIKNPIPQNLSNIAFMTTSVTSGYGYGVVIATGKNTFFGKATKAIEEVKPITQFQKNLSAFSLFVIKIIFLMITFIFFFNSILGKGLFTSLLFSLALAVGISPEILPVIITIGLSNGALRMAKQKVITKRLAALEDFGNIDVLCADKTGTLTEGKPELRAAIDIDGKPRQELVLYGLLCNSIKEGVHHKFSENRIDKAIWESKEAARLRHLLREHKILDENEFDFERRRMSVLVQEEKERKTFLIAKGAPESVLSICSSFKKNSKSLKLSPRHEKLIKKKIVDYETQGYTVIAVAEKPLKKSSSTKSDEKGMIFLGFLLFLDPPKRTAYEALEKLKKLDVKVKIISGDSPRITRKICEEIRLDIDENYVVTGEELGQLKGEEFANYCNRYNVFARVTPEQKAKILKTLAEQGHVVGFLGDGINDVAALHSADVGISVDSGAGVAKEAADIILLHKSLDVVADGITEGRKIFGNMVKYILNTMSANLGNMTTVALSSVFLSFIPLLPVQILLLNFLSDIPLLTLSTDNVDPDLLKKPKKLNLKTISRFMIYFGILSTIIDILLIASLIFWLKAPTDTFRTAWFIESVLSEIFVTFAIRTRLPFYKSKASNLLLISSIVVGLLTVVLTFTPLGSLLFGFVSLSGYVLLLTLGIVVLYFFCAELFKEHFFRKFEV